MKKFYVILFSILLLSVFFITGISKVNSAPPGLQNIKTNLGPEWDLAFFDMNGTQWIAEYGLKGEDVVNFKWTKLITINCIYSVPKTETAKSYSERFRELLSKQAQGMGKTLSFKYLNTPDNDVWFIWSISGRNESELCRVYLANGNRYHLHYAHKKPQFTQQELNSAGSMLKNIQIASKF